MTRAVVYDVDVWDDSDDIDAKMTVLTDELTDA